jgi:nucleoside-diphosphate-sugar epimerase
MRVFLAGATGVLGRRLVPLLLGAGHQVTGMTRTPARAETLRAAGADPVVCDALDAAAVEHAVGAAQPEVVVHQLTALPTRINPRRMGRDLALNDRLREEGTRHLVAAARAAGARRMVAQSIAFAYAPNPDGSPTPSVLHDEQDPLFLDAPEPWRRSVRAVDILEHTVTGAPELAGVVLRYGYFYGPGTSYAGDGAVTEQVRRRQFPLGGGGRAVWSFVHVDDAARATLMALEGEATGTFNVVDDDPAPMAEWLPALAAALQARPPRRVPLVLVRLIAGQHAAFLMTRAEGASNERARRDLGWSPQIPSWREGFRTALG